MSRVASAEPVIEKALEQGNLEQAVHYLQSLQNFAMYVTGYNKPAVLELEGQISNSAAAIFLSMPWVNLKDAKAEVKFNEMEKGSPLLGGSSYVLSRMPRGVGRYIALTSAVIRDADLWNLNLVNMKLDFDPTTLRVMEDTLLHLPRFREVSLVHKLPQYVQLRDSLVREGLLPEAINREFLQDFKTSDPRSALIKAVSNDMLIRHANQLEQTTNIGTWAERYKSIQQTGILPTIENRYGTVEKFVMSQVRSGQGMFGHYPYSHKGEISNNLADIANYFAEGDFSSIKARLQNSNSKWAKEALARLESCDPKLADSMLSAVDFAEEHDYVSCLVNEYHTALSYYSNFVEGGFSRVSTAFTTRSPPKALLPVREYIMEFPDAVRMALNNTHNADPFVDKNFGDTVRTFLNMQGIDILNPVTNLDVAREVLWRRKKNQLDIQREKDRLTFLGQNAVARKTFANSRRSAIDQLLSDPKKATTAINTEMMNAFNQKFANFQSLVGSRSRTANYISRRKQIKTLREVASNAFLTTDPMQKIDPFLGQAPLEIVDDPSNPSDKLLRRHVVSQRSEKLQRKRNFTPANVRAYLNGTATIYDLYAVDPKDAKDTLVADPNINRGLQLPYNLEEDLAFLREYKMRLLLHKTEDEREVKFREQNLEELTDFIEKVHGEALEPGVKQTIIEEAKRQWFDTMNGTNNPFEYQDAHNFVKPGQIDVSDVLMVHRSLKKSTNETDFPLEVFKDLNELIDIQTELLAPKAFTAVDSDKLESKHLKPVRNGLADGTILEDVPVEDLWKHNKMLEFKTYQESMLKGSSSTAEVDGLEQFVHDRVQENDYLRSRLSFLAPLESTSEQSLSEVQQMVNSVLRDRFFGEVKKELATRFGDLPALISESPVMLKGFGSDPERFNYVNGVDYYLLRNLQLDSFEMWAPNVFTSFCQDVLQDLEEGFDRVSDQPVYPTAFRNQKDWGKPRAKALQEFIKEFLASKHQKAKHSEVSLTQAQLNEATIILERTIFDLVELLGYYESASKKAAAPKADRFRGVVDDPDPKPSKQFHKQKRELEEQAEEEAEQKRRAEQEQAWLARFDLEHTHFYEAVLTKGDPGKLVYMDYDSLLRDGKKLPSDIDKSHLLNSYHNEKTKLTNLVQAQQAEVVKQLKAESAREALGEYDHGKQSLKLLVDHKAKVAGIELAPAPQPTKPLKAEAVSAHATKDGEQTSAESPQEGEESTQVAQTKEEDVSVSTGAFATRLPRNYRSEYRYKRVPRQQKDPLQADALSLEAINNPQEMELHMLFNQVDPQQGYDITPYTRLRDALKIARDFQEDSSTLSLTKDEHQARIKLSLLELANMKQDKDSTREEINNLVATYHGYIGALADRRRVLREGPINLIFELESVLKRMNEGEESGVDDDFSNMERLLQDNVVERGQTPDAWVRSKVDASTHPAQRLLLDPVCHQRKGREGLQPLAVSPIRRRVRPVLHP